jgi:hypothetical protein
MLLKRRPVKAKEISREISMGRRQDRALGEYPEIAKAYSLYATCRRRHLIVANVPKGSKGDTVLKMIPYTDGLQHLPVSGGILDQPYRIMTFFDIFEAGEQEAFNLRLK